jgi:hypothetical protein
MKDAMRQSRKIRHSQDDEHQTYEGLRSVVEGGAAASIQTSASVRKILTGLSEFPAVKFQASTDAIRLWGCNPREKHIPAGDYRGDPAAANPRGCQIAAWRFAPSNKWMPTSCSAG